MKIKQNEPKLKKITIKPQYACAASCSFCNPRQDLYQTINAKSRNIFSKEDWGLIFDQAKIMGVEEISISGGEPTLYNELVTLVMMITERGMKASINTNGLRISGNERNLLDAGAKNFCFSLYSRFSGIHDKIKGVPGIWNKVTESSKEIVALRNEKFKDVVIGHYFIILPDNYVELADFYDFAVNQNIDYIFISLLQGKFEDTSMYLSKKQIREFKEEVVPRLCEKISKNREDEGVILKIKNLFIGDIDELAEGKYLKNKKKICNTPNDFGIILPNGDMHACNMVEHCHDGVIGNLGKNTLSDVFYSKTAQDYRLINHEFCDYCSVPLNFIIPTNYNNG